MSSGRRARSYAIALAIALALSIGGYFVLKANLKSILEKYVLSETDDRYTLSISTLSLSLRRGELKLEQASLMPNEPNPDSSRFEIQLPLMYIKLDSWRDLLLAHLSVDSIYIYRPFVKLLASAGEGKAVKPGFSSSKIMDGLQRVMAQLSIRSFKLDSATLLLPSPGSGRDFECRNVSIVIRNFGKDIGQSGMFLSADEFLITMPAQVLNLNGGKQQVRFAGFQFSGRDQSFRLDTCRFTIYSGTSGDSVVVAADLFRFNSTKLKSIYESNELNLDTLICYNPTIRLNSRHGDQAEERDSGASVQEILASLGFDIAIGHIEVLNGQFNIEKSVRDKSEMVKTRSANIIIDSIDVRPKASPMLHVGNISVNGENFVFYTPDSLYVLSVGNFGIHKDRIELRRATFHPTKKNPDQTLSVSMKALNMNGLRLEMMLMKEFVADLAIIDSPVLLIDVPANAAPASSSGKAPDLTAVYNALHSLSSMILVDELRIENGSVKVKTYGAKAMEASASGLQAALNLKEFLKSQDLLDVKLSLPLFALEKVVISSKDFMAAFSQLKIEGSIQRSGMETAMIDLKGKMKLEGRELYWQQLQWEDLRARNAVIADSVSVGSLLVQTFAPQTESHKAEGTKELPEIKIRKVHLGEAQFKLALSEKASLSAASPGMVIEDLSSTEQHFHWSALKGYVSKLSFANGREVATAESIRINTTGLTSVSGLKLKQSQGEGGVEAEIPQLTMAIPLYSTDFSAINILQLNVADPFIAVRLRKDATEHEAGKFAVPVNLRLQQFDIANARIEVGPGGSASTSQMRFSGSINGHGIETFKSGETLASISGLHLDLTGNEVQSGKVATAVKDVTLSIQDVKVVGRESPIIVSASAFGNWSGASLSLPLKNQSNVRVDNLTGSLDTVNLVLQKGMKPDFPGYLSSLAIDRGSVVFGDSLMRLSLNQLSWDPAQMQLDLNGFELSRKQQPEEYFQGAVWQSDYITATVDRVQVSGIDLERLKSDSLVSLKTLAATNPSINVWRDKRYPFHHGILKPMPTKLILSSGNKMGMQIDSVVVSNGSVTYHEYSNVTNKLGQVPLNQLNAVMLNVKNRDVQPHDSLSIKGSMNLRTAAFQKIIYKESYHDSLSAFQMSYLSTPFPLTDFSSMTTPLAALAINSGENQLLTMRVSGNRNAVVGEMRFFYRDLKVSLLDHEDSLKKRIDLAFINFIANEFILKDKNKKKSAVFFIRDQEKFVFNYWIKTALSGVLTSTGIKHDKKYQKQYEMYKEQYHLPPKL